MIVTAAVAVAMLISLTGFAQAPAAGGDAKDAFDAARKLFDDGKWAEALAAFQKFETSYKFSEAVPQAIYLQGWCWFSLKRYQQALDVFERLLKAYPTAAIVPEATLKQAECYRELNNFAKAAELYRAFQSKYPKHVMLPQAMLGEAWMLYKQKNIAGAKTIIDNVRSKYRDDAVVNLDALFLLGQVLNEEKNFDAARAVYKEIAAQRSSPRASEGLFLAAETMFDAKNYADAIAYYDRVQSKPALLGQIQNDIDRLRAELPKRVAAGESPALAQSQIDSLRQLAAQIEERPDLRASALFRIANCDQFLGKPEEASIVYRHFLMLYPNDPLAEKAQFGLIQTLTERKQLDKADAESKAFEKKYPKSALATDALFLQAESLLGTEQYQDALERYRKFSASTQNAQLKEIAEARIADCYYGLKQFEQARDAAAAFIHNHPQSKLVPDALFRLGRSHFELSRKATDVKLAQSNLAEAVKYYEQIRTQFTNSERLPEVTFQLGYLYSYLGGYDKDNAAKLTTPANFEKAIAAFQDFINRWPNNRLAAEAMYQIARCRAALGRTDDAVAAYRQLIEKYPDNDLAPFAAYETANVFAAANKPAEMIAALRAYVQKFPNHARVGDALFAIGSQLENEGKSAEAVDQYHALIARAVAAGANLTDDLRNAAIAAQLRIAGILEQRGDLPGAVADCEKFLAQMSGEPIAVRVIIGQIATMYRKAKMLPEAVAKLDQLSAQYQQNTAVRIAVITSSVELALSEKDYQRAYTAALKLLADPEKDRLPAPSYVAAGNALLKAEKFAQARDAFQKVRTLYPNDVRMAPLASLGLGQASLALNDLDQAEAAFNKMLADDPQSPVRPEAELGLAKINEARGKTREAADLYNKVMAAGRGDTASEASLRLGNFFFGQKDFKTALAYYLRVALLAGGPMGEEAAFHAAECHEALGNVEAARSAYQSFIRRFPNSSQVPKAKEKLSALPAPKPQP
jgi:TolA-binding protein